VSDDVLDRHASAARIIQSRLISRIVNMTEADLAGLSAAEIVRIWDSAVRIERASQPMFDSAALAEKLGLDPEP
jgi:hypothetical protein